MGFRDLDVHHLFLLFWVARLGVIQCFEMCSLFHANSVEFFVLIVVSGRVDSWDIVKDAARACRCVIRWWLLEGIGGFLNGSSSSTIKGVGLEAIAISCGPMCKLGSVGFGQLKKFIIGWGGFSQALATLSRCGLLVTCFSKFLVPPPISRLHTRHRRVPLLLLWEQLSKQQGECFLFPLLTIMAAFGARCCYNQVCRRWNWKNGTNDMEIKV